MEFDDYVSYMVYCEGIAVQSEVVVKLHILDSALMFLGFCKSKRGRALQAQAAAGIDAAGAEDDLLNLHGEGANKLEEAFLQCMTGKAKHPLKGCESCATQYRAGGGSILGHVAEESALLSCQRARTAVVLVFGVARAPGGDIGPLV